MRLGTLHLLNSLDSLDTLNSPCPLGRLPKRRHIRQAIHTLTPPNLLSHKSGRAARKKKGFVTRKDLKLRSQILSDLGRQKGVIGIGFGILRDLSLGDYGLLGFIGARSRSRE